jgi:glycosyltransferase involved in cell wall biosynthesis
MKIALIGPGIMPIPPPGWGAVEILIWEYYNKLKELGHNVHIINTPDTNQIIKIVNDNNFDVAHLHYDVFYHILDHLKCKKTIMTSHYPYILDKSRHQGDGFAKAFQFMATQNKHYIHCLSQETYHFFVSEGADKDKLFLLPNGANDDLFAFVENPIKTNRAIYLGKIEHRKKQYVYQDINIIDFVGKNWDNKFNTNRSNYLGEWSKEFLYHHLTEYPTLVLLSEGELCPLVCTEALIAGLGLVVSSHATANLDLSKPYITVIPDEKLEDLDYVGEAIKQNIEVSKKMRKEIRDYGIQMFSWNTIAEKYISILESLKIT